MPDHEPADRPVEVTRPDDEDYDLLTYGEAGARLAQEIRQETERLTELQSAGGDDVEIAAAQRRLAELEAAVRRQQAAASEAADFTRFFGYDPKAK
jgi:hypothetical protein